VAEQRGKVLRGDKREEKKTGHPFTQTGELLSRERTSGRAAPENAQKKEICLGLGKITAWRKSRFVSTQGRPVATLFDGRKGTESKIRTFKKPPHSKKEPKNLKENHEGGRGGSRTQEGLLCASCE